jgi:NifU-like protein involved in Fe-S cluster formation
MLSPIAADHVYNPRNQGPIEGFTHFGQVGCPGEGAFMSLWFRVEDGIVKQASYATHGCAWSIACASVLCQMLTNREVGKTSLLEARDIDLVLGGVPEGKGEFPGMAVEALANARLM